MMLITILLLVCCFSAFGCTMYGAASCKYFAVLFDSTYSDTFESHFQQSALDNGGDSVVQIKAMVGLFQWLRPIAEIDSDDEGTPTTDTFTIWNAGTCTGYQQTMLEVLANGSNARNFEIARIFGVFSVLLGIVITVWVVIILTCMDMNILQLWLFRVISLFITISTGITLLLTKSSVCDNDSYHDGGRCSLQNGGYAMIAATILWFVTFLMSVLYMRTSAASSATPNSKRREQISTKTKKSFPTKKHSNIDASTSSHHSLTPKKYATQPKAKTARQPAATKKNYISNRLDNIESLVSEV